MWNGIEFCLLILLPVKSTFTLLDSNFELTVKEIVFNHGYPYEEHLIEAPDGALSMVHRLPHSPEEAPNCSRIPVLMFHCITCSSNMWVQNSRNKSLGFVLVDNGYDVWMANQRGNPYSSHKYLTVDNPGYWDFSFQESALIDVPLIIDHILNETGHSKLFYIGMSMGTTISFMMLSTRTEYNDKIHAVLDLSPVVYLEHTNYFFKTLIYIAYTYQKLIGSSGSKPFDLLTLIFRTVFEICFEANKERACAELILSFLGDDISQFEQDKVVSFLYSFPHETSARNIAHYWQIYQSGEFKMYDFEDESKNKQVYKQITPPSFDVSRITAPVALYSALYDSVGSVLDLKRVAMKLPNLIFNAPILTAEGSGHLSTVFGKRAYMDLFPKMLNLMRDIIESQDQICKD